MKQPVSSLTNTTSVKTETVTEMSSKLVRLPTTRNEKATPPLTESSLGLSDQDLDTFIDIDIKQEPVMPGMEIFEEINSPRQHFEDAPGTSSHHSPQGPPLNKSNLERPTKPRKRLSNQRPESTVDEVLRLALNELKRTSVAERQDDDNNDVCMTFGQMVASEMEQMNPLQRVVAKKLISELIFHGSLGTLQVSTTVKTNLNSEELDAR